MLCRTEDEKHSQEVSQFQQELAEARSQLQVLQKNLDDKLSEQPLISQEVKSEHLLRLSVFPLHCMTLFSIFNKILLGFPKKVFVRCKNIFWILWLIAPVDNSSDVMCLFFALVGGRPEVGSRTKRKRN